MAIPDLLEFHSFCVTNTGTRLDQYARAIAAAVRPGDVVVDLGTGTGLLAFLACRAGASRVYALDESDAIAFGSQLASSAGVLDRVEFIGGPSSRVTLPERVDVVVADIHDTFGLQARGLAALFDARNRFLKPGGSLIPQMIRLYLAPVEAPREYERLVNTWRQSVHGVDLSPLRRLAVNQEHPGRFDRSQLLSAPAALATITLGRSDDLHVSGSVHVTAARDGTLHGVCGSFVSTLAEGIDMSNEPGRSETTNFAQAFFPIESPVAVSHGDEVSMSLDSFDGTELRWRVDITSRADGSRMRFEHATLHALPLSLDALRKQADDHRPVLTTRGAMERALLERLDGSRSVADLTTWLADEFGALLPSRREAAAFLKSTIERCG